MALTTDGPVAPGGPDTGAPIGVPPAPRLTHRRAFLGSRRRQVVAGAIIAAAIGFLVFEGLGNATQYYKTVPQAVNDRASLGTKPFRIMGDVDNDIREVDHRTNFDVTWKGVTVPVVDSHDPPSLFKAGIPVVLVGHFASGPATVFDSDLIMVKHTANYVPAKGEPKSVVKQSAAGS